MYVLFQDILGEEADFMVYIDDLSLEKEKILIEMYYRDLLNGLVMAKGTEKTHGVGELREDNVYDLVEEKIKTPREIELLLKVRSSEDVKKAK